MMPLITLSLSTPREKKLATLCVPSAAAARLALNGRVLGISGIAGGIARGQLDAPRVAFTAGLLGAGALALPALLPASSTTAAPYRNRRHWHVLYPPLWRHRAGALR